MRYILSLLLLLIIICIANTQVEVYELRTYHLTLRKSQQILDEYLENALIPALNRQGIQKVGVFEEMDDRMPKKLYLLIPYSNLDAFSEIRSQLAADDQYLEEAETYFEAVDQMPYVDITTNLIQSTKGFPNLTSPAQKAELFELRIYESANEDALRRKVKMFDDHEFPIFADAGLPMLFFGYNIAGDQMPCLTYMLALKDMENHKEGWPKFISHPEWKRITKLKEFENTVDEIIRVFLKPVSYSQI